ncbi:MAG TPA: Do family serine endopeptidase [Bryobacteraceae bacterium]|nr:Do family serine endopeptidase [Bryobacteraceae bacterium]
MKLFDKMRQQKLLSITLSVFTLSVGILIGTLINTQVNAAKGGHSIAPDATPLVLPKPIEIGNDFSKLAKKLEPSVVYIEVEVNGKQETSEAAPGQGPQGDNGGGDDDGSDLLRRFFGNQIPQIAPQQSLRREQSGSGFIVDKNGYIVTNRHVVDGGTRIMVKLQDDPREYRAKIIGEDVETDLAVIKIDAHKPLPVVTIGNSDSVQVGDWAVAIGSPFGQVGSVTAGIISATGRDVAGSAAFQHFIQTDAAINPGNSGGPLLNIRGEVIGVNTMIATSRGGSEGVGFALPVNMVAKVYNDIIQDGRVTRSSIGATIQSNPTMLKGLGFDHGVIVVDVTKGGPSDKAGVKSDDIITAINGKPVKDSNDLISRVADTPVGNQLTLNIDRDGKKLNLGVVTQDRMDLYKDNPAIVGEDYVPGGPNASASTSAVKFGIGVRPLSEQERETTPDKKGVMVTQVQEDSFAEGIGMQERDIITSINRHPVNSPEDVRAIAEMLKPGDAVTFHVIVPQPAGRGRGAASADSQPASRYLAGTLPE